MGPQLVMQASTDSHNLIKLQKEYCDIVIVVWSVPKIKTVTLTAAVTMKKVVLHQDQEAGTDLVDQKKEKISSK